MPFYCSPRSTSSTSSSVLPVIIIRAPAGAAISEYAFLFPCAISSFPSLAQLPPVVSCCLRVKRQSALLVQNSKTSTALVNGAYHPTIQPTSKRACLHIVLSRGRGSLALGALGLAVRSSTVGERIQLAVVSLAQLLLRQRRGDRHHKVRDHHDQKHVPQSADTEPALGCVCRNQSS